MADPATIVTDPPAGSPGATQEPPKAPASAQEPSIPGQQEVNGQKVVPLAALQEARDEVKNVKLQLEALKQVVGDRIPLDPATGLPHPANPQGGAAPAATPQHPQQAELDRLWETDPRKAVETMIAGYLGWYDQVNQAVTTQENSVASKHRDFDSYRAEIRSYLNTLPAEQRAKPGVVELAYYVVKGQKVDQLIDQTKTQLLDRLRRGEEIQGFNSGTVSTSTAPQPIKLTAEQIAVAENLGMTPEEYAKHIKKT